MTPEQRTEVLNKVIELVDSRYVFAEVGSQIRRRLEQRMAEGGLASAAALADPAEFCRVVTAEMQAVSGDKHLRLRPRDPARFSPAAMQGADREEFLLRRRHQNHGFARVERLEGNVGYLDLRGFEPPDGPAGQTAVAAMQFLNNAEALIFDLRKCPGGSPGMVALIISYLFDGPPVHLNDFYDRNGESIYQSWTLSYVPGRRMPAVPVYVLTSGVTFSAAEEFTYDLKQLKRAVIVGEQTGGGANPGGNIPVGHDLELFVPGGRAHNPVSRDNWEGKGIEPDIAVPAEQALAAAYADALKQVAEKARTQQGGAWEALALEAETALARLAG